MINSPIRHLKGPSSVLKVEILERELDAIASWWIEHSVDEKLGGFFGEIDSAGSPVPEASKGVVQTSRLLWFFSEVAIQTSCSRSRQLAARAHDYLIDHFFDSDNGGYFWEVDHKGDPTNRRKQVYGQAFCLYGLVAFYRLSGDEIALKQAVRLFRTIESKCVEPLLGGYTEAFREDWSSIDDYRLSERDHNFSKTLNTHLHVLEAYTAFHKVARSQESESALRGCVNLFLKRFRRPDFHFRMFLDQQWTDHSVEISYGHEIELSWLMCEACQSLNDDALISQAEKDAVRIAGLSLGKAMCSGHGFLERIEFDKPVDSSRIWWVQAEALVGFYNAFQISNERQFLKATEDIWQFIQSQHKVSPKSEWLWSSDDRELAPESRAHYLAGFWKGPYHNGRAMLELLRRVPLSDSADAT